ncbi:hypothetical protein HD597_009495 [Nonomuraea thailandensis]|uniref:Uncharacterized protein n=1 Tax=Nonomuraea thailandensis TaxID=1188745 RepID=A0A9X2GR49_9ACTN|nr:hypothetical protein [Nonomuraea thailandensis]MCP2362475.1 hypothetical protein [Nonomuraea thailandensis]
MLPAGLSETEYLRHIELLARDVIHAANEEGWLTYDREATAATPLHRAVNELARQIRHHHFSGDGCLEDDLPLMRLAGIVLLHPKAIPPDMEGTYEEICARLGVPPAADGWAVWNAWAHDRQPISIVLADTDGTEGILVNWAHGIEVYPAAPLPAQVVLTRQGWITPMTLSPLSARKLGVTRPPYWTPDASGEGTPAPG